MEELNIFITAVSTVGFPIAACIAMFLLYNKIVTDMLPIITQLSENLKDVKNAMEDNKETMQEVKLTLNLFNQNFSEIFKRLNTLEEGKK